MTSEVLILKIYCTLSANQKELVCLMYSENDLLVRLNNSLYLAGKYVRISLSVDIICSEKLTVYRECASRKTVIFEERMMSKDKYPSNVFCNTDGFNSSAI